MVLVKTRDNLFHIVSLIPRGSVATYKQIASIAGIKNPRTIGSILNTNTDPKNVPCNRVVKSDGTLAEGYAFGGKKAHRGKLEQEGIVFDGNRINLQKYLWKKS